MDKFLKNVVLEYVGHIPFDRQLQQAVQKRGLVMDHFPDSASAQAIREIAVILGRRPLKNTSNGSLTFFMSKVFQTTT